MRYASRINVLASVTFALSLLGCSAGGTAATDPGGTTACTDKICAIENTAGASGNHWALVAGEFHFYASSIALYPDGTGQLLSTGSGATTQPGGPGYAAPSRTSFNWARSAGSTSFILISNMDPKAFIYAFASGTNEPKYGTFQSMTIVGGSISSGTFSATVLCVPSGACSAGSGISASLAGGPL
jgi:hypothetical protein